MQADRVPPSSVKAERLWSRFAPTAPNQEACASPALRRALCRNPGEPGPGLLLLLHPIPTQDFRQAGDGVGVKSQVCFRLLCKRFPEFCLGAGPTAGEKDKGSASVPTLQTRPPASVSPRGAGQGRARPAPGAAPEREEAARTRPCPPRLPPPGPRPRRPTGSSRRALGRRRRRRRRGWWRCTPPRLSPRLCGPRPHAPRPGTPQLPLARAGAPPVQASPRGP